MRTLFIPLARTLWSDISGAVLSSEYLALGNIVVLGGVGGLVAIRDASVDEMKEYRNSLRSIHQHNQSPALTNSTEEPVSTE